jgi:hypothetical protein
VLRSSLNGHSQRRDADGDRRLMGERVTHGDRARPRGDRRHGERAVCERSEGRNAGASARGDRGRAGTVTATVWTCATPLNVSVGVDKRQCPGDAVGLGLGLGLGDGDGDGEGDGATAGSPVTTTPNDAECCWSSVTTIVALPIPIAANVNVALPLSDA